MLWVASSVETRNPQRRRPQLLDQDTVITFDGDKPVTVAMQEQGATLTLTFAHDSGEVWLGETALLEVRLTPAVDGTFEPWRLVPNLPLHTKYARAALARDKDSIRAALSALQKENAPRRGLDDGFLRLIGDLYRSLVREGEPYPVTAIANAQHAHKSTASRWVSAARSRGYLEGDE